MHPAVVLAFVVATGCNHDDSCDEIANDITECYDDACDGSSAGSPFCNCWDEGKELDLGDCTCKPADFAVTMCQYFEDVSAWEEHWGRYDCNYVEAWSNYCPPE